MKYTFLLSLFISFCISSSILAQGEIIEKTIEQENGIRNYSLYVPESYDGMVAYSLVINYHGFGSNPMGQMAISEMNDVADMAQFIIAYPLALEVLNPLFNVTGTGWNVVQFLDSTYSDTKFTLDMIEAIQMEYNIDSSRIHATGWSFGSEMALSLACKLPDIIASVAGVAESMADFVRAECNPKRPYSILTIHGTADNLIPFNGGSLWSAAAETPTFFAEMNGCDATPILTELPDINSNDASTVDLYEYKNCEANTEVLFYQINDGGHNWPGGSGGGNINQDIHASVEIWNFFQRNPLPNLISSTKKVIASSEDWITLNSNPTADFLTIHSSSTNEVQLRLFDLSGQPILQERFQGTTTLDLQQLNSGIYIIYFSSKDNLISKKVVKY